MPTYLFSDMVKYLRSMEEHSGRIDKTNITTLLLNDAKAHSVDELERVVTLLTTELPVLGISDRSLLKALIEAKQLGVDFEARAAMAGGLDNAIQEIPWDKSGGTVSLEGLVWLTDKFAEMRGSGAGSEAVKGELLVTAYNSFSKEEAMYFTRLITGNVKVGVDVPTVVKSLSTIYGVDEGKINDAHRSGMPLGRIVHNLDAGKALERQITLGTPLKPMLAQKANSLEELDVEKEAYQYKFDGLRMQIHKSGSQVWLFSRNGADITAQYPDVVKAVDMQFSSFRGLLLDGEVVALADDGTILPFQTLMKRKRVHDIQQIQEEVPVRVYLFDVLQSGDEELLDEPYSERWERLKRIVKMPLIKSDLIELAPHVTVKSQAELEVFYNEAVKAGLEGLVAKDLDSPYEIGARKATWKKLKPSYMKGKIELDLAVVGVYFGKGRRTGTFGSLLVASRRNDGTLQTLTTIGTGFNDETLAELPSMLKLTPEKPANLESDVVPDMWVEPETVVEVIGDNLTVSPMHTTARNDVVTGLSLRFPRFVRFRPDKTVAEVTSSEEIYNQYLHSPEIAEKGEIGEKPKLPVEKMKQV